MQVAIEDSTRDNECITYYTGEIIPHIGETIYFSRKGSFKVVNVVYNISDDNLPESERMMWVSVSVEKITGGNEKNPTTDLDTSAKYMEGYQAGYKAAAQATIDTLRGAKE